MASARPSENAPLTVLGAGSWGTALAIHLARRDFPVRLWTRNPDHAAEMASAGHNPRYLVEYPFPPGITAVADLPEALAGAHGIVVAIPSHGMGAVLAAVARAWAGGVRPAPDAEVLLASKGLELETLEPMHEVALRELPGSLAARLAVLGGPSFAAEVARGLPTAVVVGSEDASTALQLQYRLSGAGIRAYVTDDVAGVELGGALKNIIALAAGMCDGAGLGQNARAGLITRGLAEMTRLAVALGAMPATFSGLAGLGDLVLTCTGGLSRNRRVGLALGQGKQLSDILEELGMVAEGVKTTRAAHELAARENVDMPIVETMDAILYRGLTVQAAVDALMGRKLRAERD